MNSSQKVISFSSLVVMFSSPFLPRGTWPEALPGIRSNFAGYNASQKTWNEVSRGKGKRGSQDKTRKGEGLNTGIVHKKVEVNGRYSVSFAGILTLLSICSIALKVALADPVSALSRASLSSKEISGELLWTSCFLSIQSFLEDFKFNIFIIYRIITSIFIIYRMVTAIFIVRNNTKFMWDPDRSGRNSSILVITVLNDWEGGGWLFIFYLFIFLPVCVCRLFSHPP